MMTYSDKENKTVIAIRADASSLIGTGHIMRCLTLADHLSQEGAQCHFIIRHAPPALLDLIKRRHHTVHTLTEGPHYTKRSEDNAHASWLETTWEQDAEDTNDILQAIQPEWLIVDHYALDARWQKRAIPASCKLLVIDDLFDRPHLADILLDQNLGREPIAYKGLVPAHCKVLLGPQYALLRPEFKEWRERSLKRRKEPKLENILITLGGADADNITGWLLEALETFDDIAKLKVIVVLGASSPHIEAVNATAYNVSYDVEVLQNVENMAELMTKADLCFGAAGSTSWERACLGLPSAIFCLAENQREASQQLELIGEVKLLTINKPKEIAEVLINFQNHDVATHLSKIIDGSSTKLLAAELLKY